MSKLLDQLSLAIYKQFKLFWILLTLILIVTALYINWNLSLARSYKDIRDVATNLSNNVDGFIEDLFQEIYTLPIYGKNFPDCKNSLHPYLEHITLNNPNIAGLTISDSNSQLICSTLPDNETFIYQTVRARTLLGPFTLSLFDQPVYLVQQKMGNYHIGILVVASVLQKILTAPPEQSDSIALYNRYEKKNIIRINQNRHHNVWLLSKKPEARSPDNTQFMVAIDKLQTIDGVVVVVFENHRTVLYNLLFSELVITLLLLTGFYFLYFLFKNLFTRRFSLHGTMKSALKNKEFYPAYQPLYDCTQKTFSGVEVLLRWQDKQNQIIMPDFFIAEAEKTRLIIPMTLDIVETSFKEAQTILKDNTHFHLAFNISALHFIDLTFFKKFKALVEQYRINTDQIIFEITERDLIDKNNAMFSNTMSELRKEGYSLAIDDYGTGHANISYLHNFPFNYLKIDKLFIQAIGTEAITESLNDAIIQMAKDLKLIIIAEGVETEEQVRYLSQNGVRFLQGWYFSKALSIDQLTKLLHGGTNEALS